MAAAHTQGKTEENFHFEKKLGRFKNIIPYGMKKLNTAAQFFIELI